jgi:tetratricopeptide (TPR) repeat protein
MTDLLSLAVSAIRSEDFAQGYRLLQPVLRDDPGNAAAWFNLGGLLERHRRWSGAAACFRRADELKPGVPDVLMALGWHLHLAGRSVEAEGVLRRCIEADSGKALAYTNLSHVLATLGRDEESLRYALRAADLDPTNNLVRLGEAFALFFAGRWLEGFRAFECRLALKMPDLVGYPWPRWDGGCAVGTLYLRAEQGLGDTLMMMRYLPEVDCRAERVVFYVQRELLGLAREMYPAWDVRCVTDPMPEVDVDAWCPLMGLPSVLGLACPYWDGAYIGPNPGIQIYRPGLRVGIAWFGDAAHDNDAHRSIPLDVMLRLTEVGAGGIEFVSLQAGQRGTDEINAASCHALVRDMAPEMPDMRAAVDVYSTCDLVICVDTAASHFAGAMGIPCWMLVNQRGRDWRWLRSETTTEWYPGHRIFARSLDEQWSDVIARVAEELRAWVSGMVSVRAA